MTLKSTLFGLTLATLTLAPTLARAGDWDDDGDRDDRRESEFRYTEPCRHGATPVATAQPAGHYETRTVQRWVEDAYQQVWIEETCRARPYRRPVCYPGYYEQQLIPGHYENVQEQVWVADTYQPQARMTWRARGAFGRVGFRWTGGR